MRAARSDGDGIRAGAAKADITPQKDIQIGGDIGRRRPTEEIVDPLYAKALMLDRGGKKLCIVVLDLIAASDAWVDRIRDETAKRCGLDRDAVIVHCIQTHAGPSLGHFMSGEGLPWITDDLWWLRGGDDRYDQPAFDRIMTAIEQANANLRPVKIAVGRGADGRVAFNRRFVMRDGSGKCHPPRCSPDILYCEGPIDPQVAVVTLTGDDSEPVATILHHTCHPCHFYPLTKISAGWPGAWSDQVTEHVGGGVSLVLNGFCGNVHHTNHLDRHHNASHIDVADKLTETAICVLNETMRPVDDPVLDWTAATIHIPLRKLDPKLIRDAEELLEKHPTPIWLDEQKTRVDWSWCYAVDRIALKHLHERTDTQEQQVQVLRIGDIAVVAARGEPFVESQLQIKAKSPAAYTLCAHMCGGSAGYVPTAESLKRGGYETDLSMGSCLAPEALDMITDAAIGAMDRLWD